MTTAGKDNPRASDVLRVPLSRTVRDDPAALGRSCRGVVERRLGLSGLPETMATIAADLGVSVQRVQQLSAMGMAAFEASSGWPGIVRRRLFAISPFTLDRLRDQPWAPFEGDAWSLAAIRVTCGGGIRSVRLDGIEAYATLERGGWPEAIKAVVASVGRAPSRTSDTVLIAACEAFVGPANRGLSTHLAAAVRASEPSNGKRQPLIHVAVDHVMRKAKAPLHAFDVLYAVEAYMLRQVSLPKVQAQLAEAHVRVDSGRYVLGR